VAIDLEYVREHYASLSDEALLDVERADLTPAAQAIYDSEVRRRRLHSGESQDDETGATEQSAFFGSGEYENEEDHTGWLENAFPVTTFSATAGGIADAADARAALVAAGIPCEVTEHEIDPEEQAVQEPYKEYRVMVPAASSLQAVSVLDTAIFNPRYEADLQTQLESLSDEELRALKIESLCAGLLDRAERLRKAYVKEISRRSQTRTS
jgi:hypothetical protein